MNEFKSRRWAINIAILTFSLCAMLVLFGSMMTQRVNHFNALWNNYDHHAIAINDSLHELDRSFGYGGFIHHFKNLVLRKDTTLVPYIENSLKQAYIAIRHMKDSDPDLDAQNSIVQIKIVVDLYAKKLELAKKLILQGLTPIEIDARVKVNDTPALVALNLLAKHARADHNLMSNETRHHLEKTINFMQWAYLLIPFFIIFGITIFMFLQKSHASNAYLKSSKRYIEELMDAIPDALLIIDKQGEILQANMQAEHLLGYKRDELTGRQVESLIPEHFRKGHKMQRNSSFSTRASRPMSRINKLMPFTALTRDGREIPVDINISFSIQDNQTLAITSIRDISDRIQMETELRRNEKMMKQAQEIAHLGTWEWNIEQNIMHWSDESSRILGVNIHDVTPSLDTMLAQTAPKDRQRLKHSIEETASKNCALNIEHGIHHTDGTEHIVQQNGRVFYNDAGAASRIVGNIRDITEYKKTQEKLLLTKEIYENLSEGILVTDHNKKIIDVNQSFLRLSGYTRKELLGRTPKILQSGQQEMDFYDTMWQGINSNGHWQGEVWDKHKDGHLFPVMLSIVTVIDDNDRITNYIGTFLDISTIKEHQKQLEQLAHFDPLTGVANRMLFSDRLGASLRRAHRGKSIMGLYYIDLDGFKLVNDKLGHETGDDILITFSKKMQELIREDDTVARLGGDEFCIIANDLKTTKELFSLADRLTKKLSTTVIAGNIELTVTASIGIAWYPDHGTLADELLGKADKAMYQAKRDGKNRYHAYDNTELNS